MYDTVARNGRDVPTSSVSNDSRGNYTDPMLGPNIRHQSDPSMEQSVQNEAGVSSHQNFQHKNNGSGDQPAQQQKQVSQLQQNNQKQPNIHPNHQYNRHKADSVGETSSTISVSSDSQYSGADLIHPKITISKSQQDAKPSDQSNRTELIAHQNNDTGQDEGDQIEDHLALVTNQKDSRKNLTTPEQRKGSGQQPNTGVLPVSSRTEPFSSEGEEDEEEEEEDEDSAALRGAMQGQLDNNPVVRVEVTKHASPDKQGKMHHVV